MTDYPIEQAQHDTHLEGFHGTVIIGGLGLGYAANTLLKRPEIDRIVVVEKSQEVIQLVAPYIWDSGAHGPNRCEVVHADLFEYLEEEKHTQDSESFDFAFYDIWQSDGETTFHDYVVPLRQLSWSCGIDEVVCWNEDIMRGQLYNGLRSRMAMLSGDWARLDPTTAIDIDLLCNYSENKWFDWSVPFFKGIKEERYTASDLEIAGYYVQSYGHGDLERWDTTWEAMTS